MKFLFSESTSKERVFQLYWYIRRLRLPRLLSWRISWSTFRYPFYNCSFCSLITVSLFLSGSTHTPNILEDSLACSRFRDNISLVEEVATKSNSELISMATHFPLFRTYLIRYHQLLSILNAPSVTYINEPHLLTRLCIEDSTSTELVTDYKRSQSYTYVNPTKWKICVDNIVQNSTSNNFV